MSNSGDGPNRESSDTAQPVDLCGAVPSGDGPADESVREFGFKPTRWSIFWAIGLSLFVAYLVSRHLNHADFGANRPNLIRIHERSPDHPAQFVIEWCLCPMLAVYAARLLARRREGRQRVRLTSTSLIAPVAAASRREVVVPYETIRRIRVQDNWIFPNRLIVAHTGGVIWLSEADISGAIDLAEIKQLVRERMPPKSGKWQFSLRELFLWTTVVACALAFIQSMKLPEFAAPINVTLMLVIVTFLADGRFLQTWNFFFGFFVGAYVEVASSPAANTLFSHESRAPLGWFPLAFPIHRLTQSLGLSAAEADFVGRAAGLLLAGALGGTVAVLLVRLTKRWWQKWPSAAGH